MEGVLVVSTHRQTLLSRPTTTSARSGTDEEVEERSLLRRRQKWPSRTMPEAGLACLERRRHGRS